MQSHRYYIINYLWVPDESVSKSYKDLTEKINTSYNPHPSISALQLCFISREQKEHESFIYLQS